MCKSVYSYVKRTELEYYSLVPNGQNLTIIQAGFLRLSTTMIHKIATKEGVLLFVQIVGYPYWNGVRVLWYPTYGAGGWVDLAKDEEVRTMVQIVSNAIETTERLMTGCMVQ